MLSGGVKLIPITTPKGTFRVWTKRIGNNPTIKVLLLHGGPGLTHEDFEAVDSYFPAAGVEYYYYDQLGSYYSDQPTDSSLWDLPRFVEEVEQVRQASKLDSTNFFLLGQSWGGMLAIEYALKYQQHLKGLIISNMMSSIPAYNEYAEQGADAGDGPEGPGRGEGAGGEGGLRESAVHGAADPESLRRARHPHAARPVARSGQPGLQAPQSRRSTSRCRDRASWARAASW